MAKFKGRAGVRVHHEPYPIIFRHDIYETEDESEIKALRKAIVCQEIVGEDAPAPDVETEGAGEVSSDTPTTEKEAKEAPKPKAVEVTPDAPEKEPKAEGYKTREDLEKDAVAAGYTEKEAKEAPNRETLEQMIADAQE